MTNTPTPPAGDRQHVPTDQAAPERITVARRIGTGRRDVMGPERTLSMGYVDAVEYVRADLAAPSAKGDLTEWDREPFPPREIMVQMLTTAIATNWNDDRSEPQTEKRRRAIDRAEAMAMARAYIEQNEAAPSTPAEVEGLVERHQDKQRNFIINRASSDLYRIISEHDPEVDHLGNRVWDRLDKMACEIEAHRATALTAQQAEIERLTNRAERAEADLAREELSHTGTIKQRDFAEQWADKLAYAIGGDAIGEHSSANNPWSKALAKLKGDV